MNVINDFIPKQHISYSLLLIFFLAGCTAVKKIPSTSKKYFSLINEAELCIINEDYSKADKLYKQAFKTKNHSFSDDVYNSIKVAQLLKDTLHGVKMTQRLLELGLCNEILEEFSFVKNNINEDEIDIGKGQILIYKNSIENLFNDDQDIRYSGASKNEILEVDSLNYVKFKQLIQNYGFPSERKIGIECSNNKKGIAPQPFKTLVFHFAQKKFNGIEELLYSLLKNNSINPYEYAKYIGPTRPAIPYHVVPIVIINEKYYTYKTTKEDKIKINKQRRKIGLPTIDEHIAKIKYKKLQKNKFRLYTPIDQYNGLSEDIIEDKFVEITLF